MWHSLPTPYGIANIFDWDLIIWLLSQIRQAADRDLPVSRKIHFSRRAYLKDARRNTSGDEYQRLLKTITRLKTTTVITNIRAKKRRVMFNWLEFVDVEKDENGYLKNATVVLPEWLFEAVCDHRLVLTLHRDYFLLKGGIERWLYRLVRKSAGNRPDGWSWRFRLLHERSGVTRDYKYFARDLRKLIQSSPLLDYQLSAVKNAGEDFLHARKIDTTPTQAETAANPNESPPPIHFLKLKLDTCLLVGKLASHSFDLPCTRVRSLHACLAIKKALPHGTYTATIQREIVEKRGISIRSLSRYRYIAERVETLIDRVRDRDKTLSDDEVYAVLRSLSTQQAERLLRKDSPPGTVRKHDMISEAAGELFGNFELLDVSQLVPAINDNLPRALVRANSAEEIDTLGEIAADCSNRKTELLLVMPIRLKAAWHSNFNGFIRCVAAPEIVTELLPHSRFDEFQRVFRSRGVIYFFTGNDKTC